MDECIKSISPFCQDIVIVIADKFWTGGEENEEILDKVREYCKDNNKIILKEIKINDSSKSPWYWEEKARKKGIYCLLNKDITHILFVDTDEIIETNRMIEWLDTSMYLTFDTIQLACYWYWRERRFQAKKYEEGPCTLMKIEAAWEWYKLNHLIQGRAIIGNFVAGVLHQDKKPMVHHYSWVRNKEEMKLKTSSWCDNKKANWEKLIEEHFEKEFDIHTMTDFVPNHHYEYIEVSK